MEARQDTGKHARNKAGKPNIARMEAKMAKKAGIIGLVGLIVTSLGC